MTGKLKYIIITSFYMMLLMGTVYAYSVFRTEIKDMYQVSTLVSGLPYMLSLSFYAFSMMITGRFINDHNIRKIVLTGSVMIVLGFFISYMTDHFIIFCLAYGVTVGYGVGMVYGVPVYIVQKHLKRRTSFYTGLILLGFGLSPLITAPLIRTLIYLNGLQNAFLILSILFLVTQVPLSLTFKFNDLPEIKEIIKEPKTIKYINKKFFIIYGLFALTTTSGLMMIGLSYQVGVAYYHFDSRYVTLAISFFALCNGLARPTFGYLVDKYDIIKPSFLSLFLMLIGALLGLLNQGEHFILYVLSYGIFWANLGAWLSMMPAIVKKYYKQQHYAKLYGLIFTAYGFGAITSTLISGSILDSLGVTSYIYVAILLLAGLSSALVLQLKNLHKGV